MNVNSSVRICSLSSSIKNETSDILIYWIYLKIDNRLTLVNISSYFLWIYILKHYMMNYSILDRLYIKYI